MVATTEDILILETPRMFLRMLTPEVYDFIYTNYVNEDIMDFLGLADEDALAADRKKWEGGFTTYRQSICYFQLIHKENSKVIGGCGFHTWYLPHNRAEIGYHMSDEAYKNKGLMKEATAAILTYGFEEMKLNRVEAMIGVGNEPSIKLVLGFGFKEEGLMRGHYCKNGVYEDSLVYGLLREEYNPTI